MDDIKISVRNANAQEAVFTVPYDLSMTDFLHLFRSILFWLTWPPSTIDACFPEPDREWEYCDESKKGQP